MQQGVVDQRGGVAQAGKGYGPFRHHGRRADLDHRDERVCVMFTRDLGQQHVGWRPVDRLRGLSGISPSTAEHRWHRAVALHREHCPTHDSGAARSLPRHTQQRPHPRQPAQTLTVRASWAARLRPLPGGTSQVRRSDQGRCGQRASNGRCGMLGSPAAVTLLPPTCSPKTWGGPKAAAAGTSSPSFRRLVQHVTARAGRSPPSDTGTARTSSPVSSGSEASRSTAGNGAAPVAGSLPVAGAASFPW